MKNRTTAARASHTFIETLLGAWQDDPVQSKQKKPTKHRQLYDVIRSSIAAGEARTGLQLPSTRECAAVLGLGRNTVLRAYQQLLDEGYLETRQGDGTFVAAAAAAPDRQPAAARERMVEAHRGQLSSRAERILDQMREHGASDVRGMPGADAVRRAFVPGPDITAFPWKVWHRLVQRQLHLGDMGRFRPTVSGGDPRLKAAVAEHVHLARGVRCASAQVLITGGAQQALLLLTLALGNPGDVAWVEEPGYEGMRAAIEAAGMRVVPVPVDDEGLAWHAGLPAPRMIFVTPSHQYPLGTVMSLDRRRALLAAASHFDAVIVEDDYDSEFRHGDRPLPSLQGLDAEHRVVYLGTFGRVLFHRLRLAYLVLPPGLAEPLRRLNTRLFRDPPPTDQKALADFIEEGHFAAHIRRMRVIYRRRRDKLCASLRTALGARVQIMGVEAGVHLILRLPDGIDDRAVSHALENAGLEVMPLSDFHMETPAFPGLILAYGSVDDATLALATFRLCSVLGTLLGMPRTEPATGIEGD